MSSYHNFQPRTRNAPAHISLYHTPYYNHSQSPNDSAPSELGIHAVTDPRLRAHVTMPNFSSLTNSALVDALLTPSAEEPQKKQAEQNTYFTASDVCNPISSGKKRAHRPDGTPDQLTRLIEDDHSDIHQHNIESRSAKKPKIQQKRRSAAPIELDDDYIEGELSDSFEDVQQKRRPRRSARSKKSPNPVHPSQKDDNEARHTSLATKIEDVKKFATAKKIRKPRANRLIRKKPIGMAVPKTLSEANDADRMMWEWKNAGRNWEEIRTEWKRLTGVEPGGSSLSVRYIKLNENLARNGAAGDIELLRFRKEAEEELMSQLWSRVADKMLAFSPESEHNPKDLQKRYNMIVRSGYDVEKLVEEDKLKREEELKTQTQCTENIDEADPRNESTTNAVSYEDQPDSTESFLNRDDMHKSHEVYRQEEPHEQDSGHASIVGDASNIFDNLDLLQHQVDGLIEPEHFEDSRYETPHCHEIDTFMSDEMLASHSPSNKRLNTRIVNRRVLPACLLVSYHTDSE